MKNLQITNSRFITYTDDLLTVDVYGRSGFVASGTHGLHAPQEQRGFLYRGFPVIG